MQCWIITQGKEDLSWIQYAHCYQFLNIEDELTTACLCVLAKLSILYNSLKQESREKRKTSFRLGGEKRYVSPPVHASDFRSSPGDTDSSLNQKDSVVV